MCSSKAQDNVFTDKNLSITFQHIAEFHRLQRIRNQNKTVFEVKMIRANELASVQSAFCLVPPWCIHEKTS